MKESDINNYYKLLKSIKPYQVEIAKDFIFELYQVGRIDAKEEIVQKIDNIIAMHMNSIPSVSELIQIKLEILK